MRTLIAASALTLALMSTPSVAQTGTGQFCLKGPTGTQCNFQTMAQCESAKPAGMASSQCIDRTQLQGTTGSGGAAPSPGGSPMPPAGGGTTSPQR
jgi:hypothetical protein